MKLRLALLSIGAALSGPAVAQIADRSFEQQGAAVGNYCYFGVATPGGPPCPTGAWQGTTGLQDEANGAFPGTATAFGSKYGFVQRGGFLSQTFTALETGSFFLSWYDAGRNNGDFPGNQSYSVTLGNQALGTFSTTTGQPFTQRTSNLFSTVANQVYTLTFQGSATSDQTAFIDNLSVSAAPEPGTWAMMIFGFGVAGTALRRRSKTAAAALA